MNPMLRTNVAFHLKPLLSKIVFCERPFWTARERFDCSSIARMAAESPQEDRLHSSGRSVPSTAQRAASWTGYAREGDLVLHWPAEALHINDLACGKTAPRSCLGQ